MKLGLALGGGSAKGLSHIGVLKVLENNNIKPDMVSGTSIGAIIGALYCSGYSAEEIEKLALEIPWRKLLDFSFPKSGLIKGDKIENFIREKLKVKNFEDLKIPLYLTSTDIQKGEEIVFNKGDIAKAVRASISIPGIFNPVINNKRILGDGGILDPLPVNILKEKGAKKTLSVNLHKLKKRKIFYETSSIEKNRKYPTIINSLFKTIQITEADLTRANIEKTEADLILTPEIEDIKYHEFNKVKDCIKKGEEITLKNLRKIKRLSKPNFLKRLFKN